jgi:shikimate kinase
MKETEMNAAIASATEAATKLAVPATVRRIVLTGFMGAGKTTVGRLLAERLGWEFLDLDAHIEARAEARIPAIFSEHGEAHFRRLESSALANALARKQAVLALGGGALEQLTNRLLLEQTPGTLVIYLDAPFPTLYDRCLLQSFASPDHIRPNLASPAEAEARYQQRQPFFRRLARHTIPTAELNAADTAEAIAAILRS